MILLINLLDEFRIHIKTDYIYNTGSPNYVYTVDYLHSLVNAITAYIINRSFEYSEEYKFGFDNLTHFYTKKAGEKINNEIDTKIMELENSEFEKDGDKLRKSEDNLENDYLNYFRKLQRLELSTRKREAELITYRKTLNINALPVSYIKNTAEGRIYDSATLERLYWLSNLNKKYDLIDHIINDRVKDEKKFPAKDFVQAYKLYDDLYEEAKKTTDKAEYIFKWINLYRMEMNYHLSLIPKIADHLLTVDKDIDFILKKLPDVWGVRYFDFGYISEPFHILRHEYEIEPLFSLQNEKELKDLLYHMNMERAKSGNIILVKLLEFFHLFGLFLYGEESAVNEIYNFCRYEYPIVERHVRSDFYRKDKPSSLDRNKIRMARKVIEYLLEPAEIKKDIEENKN